ncbi:hypothetical protein [Mucilaginibacter segetis]|uniref:Uncharacterized protein n=1 Tax=Mucilaginibacter segetis TaxID=2793071 RepID=A0A934PTJ8_9SPHI|nr:hypothetical protein [Mucilaginibacter segetis]MBK0380569.1 hypothetical protein [Mucilaginibacter segetis]
MKTNSTNLLDIKVNIKIKLAALWAALMFCYIYGDFFTLFVPGRIKGLMEGHSGAGDTTPGNIVNVCPIAFSSCIYDLPIGFVGSQIKPHT